MIGETLSRKRRGGHGLLLLVLLGILLIVPLCRHRGVDHPLAASEHIEVCPLLVPLPAEFGSPTPRAGIEVCDLRDLRPGNDSSVLSVGMSSNRSLAGGSNHGTADAYKVWVKEALASGATDMREQVGPWKMASSYRYGRNWQMVVEDGGLLISLSSERMDDQALTAYATKLAPSLRTR